MRPCISFIKERFGKHPIIGAEVGVYRGINALNILQELPNVRLLYLVDPYMKYAGYNAPLSDKVAAAKDIAKQRLSRFKNRVRWVYKKFEGCTTEEIKDPLDFIYIDGYHRYNYVKKDIVLGVQLVKSDGVVGGHDYKDWPGVRKAVDEYINEHNLELYTAGRDWWFIRF